MGPRINKLDIVTIDYLDYLTDILNDETSIIRTAFIHEFADKSGLTYREKEDLNNLNLTVQIEDE